MNNKIENKHAIRRRIEMSGNILGCGAGRARVHSAIVTVSLCFCYINKVAVSRRQFIVASGCLLNAKLISSPRARPPLDHEYTFAAS